METEIQCMISMIFVLWRWGFTSKLFHPLRWPRTRQCRLFVPQKFGHNLHLNIIFFMITYFGRTFARVLDLCRCLVKYKNLKLRLFGFPFENYKVSKLDGVEAWKFFPTLFKPKLTIAALCNPYFPDITSTRNLKTHDIKVAQIFFMFSEETLRQLLSKKKNNTRGIITGGRSANWSELARETMYTYIYLQAFHFQGYLQEWLWRNA